MTERQFNSQSILVQSEASGYYLDIFRRNFDDCQLYNAFVVAAEENIGGSWADYTIGQLYQLHVAHSNPGICDKLKHPYQSTR